MFIVSRSDIAELLCANEWKLKRLGQYMMIVRIIYLHLNNHIIEIHKVLVSNTTLEYLKLEFEDQGTISDPCNITT